MVDCLRQSIVRPYVVFNEPSMPVDPLLSVGFEPTAVSVLLFQKHTNRLSGINLYPLSHESFSSPPVSARRPCLSYVNGFDVPLVYHFLLRERARTVVSVSSCSSVPSRQDRITSSQRGSQYGHPYTKTLWCGHDPSCISVVGCCRGVCRSSVYCSACLNLSSSGRFGWSLSIFLSFVLVYFYCSTYLSFQL